MDREQKRAARMAILDATFGALRVGDVVMLKTLRAVLRERGLGVPTDSQLYDAMQDTGHTFAAIYRGRDVDRAREAYRALHIEDPGWLRRQMGIDLGYQARPLGFRRITRGQPGWENFDA